MNMKRVALTWGIPSIVVAVSAVVALTIDMSPPPEGAEAFCHPEARFALRADVADLFACSGFKEFETKIQAAPMFGMLSSGTGSSTESTCAYIEKHLGIAPLRVKHLLASWDDRDMTAMISAEGTSPFDQAAIRDAIARQFEKPVTVVTERHGIEFWGPDDDGDPLLAFPEPAIVVLGSRGVMEAVFALRERARASRLPRDLERMLYSAPPASTLVVAGVFSSEGLIDMITSGASSAWSSSRSYLFPSAARGAAVVAAAVPFRDKTRSFVGSAVAGASFELAFHANMNSRGDAADAKREATDTIAKAKAHFGMTLWVPGMGPLRRLLNGVSVGGTGSGLDLACTLEPEIVDALVPALGMGAMLGAPAAGSKTPAAP